VQGAEEIDRRSAGRKGGESRAKRRKERKGRGEVVLVVVVVFGSSLWALLASTILAVCISVVSGHY
jgi:hypothetical protein